MASLGVASLGSDFDPTGLRSGLNAARGYTEGWLGGWRRLWETTAGFLIANVIMKIAGAIRDLGREVIDAVSSFQLLNIQLSGLVAAETMDQFGGDFQRALAGSGERVRELIGWIKELAVTTPFTVKTLQRTLAVSMAMGFTSEESQSLTESIGNFTAGMGLSNEIMERIIYNFGQMKAAGKVTGTELRDLARGGFLPIVDILARMQENMGMTNISLDEFRKLAGAGKVDVNEFFKAFEEMVGDRFPGAMERMVKTWEGLKGNLKDFFQAVLGAGVLGPAFNNLTEQFSDAFAMLLTPEVQTEFENLGYVLGQIFDFDIGDPQALIDGFVESFHNFNVELLKFNASGDPFAFLEGIGVNPEFVDFLEKVNEWARTGGQWLVDNGEDVKTVLTGIGIALATFAGLSVVIGILTALVSPMFLLALAAGLIALAVSHWDEIVEKFNGFKTAFIDFVSGVWNSIVEFLQPAIDLWMVFYNTMRPALDGLLEAIGPLGDFFRTAFADLAPMFLELKDAISPVSALFREIGIVLLQVLGGAFLIVAGIVVGFVVGIWSALTAMMPMIISILDGIKNLVMGVVGFFTGFWDFLVGLFTGNAELLKQGLSQMGTSLMTFLQGLIQIIAGLIGAFFTLIIGFVSGFVTGVIDFFTNLYMTLVGGSIIPDMLMGILNWFISIFTQVSAFVITFIADLINGFLNLSNTMIVSIANAVQMIRDKFLFFMNKGKELVTFLGGTLSRAFEGVREVIQKVADVISSIISSILKLVDLDLGLFEPGSPTPFEMGLWGIHNALSAISKDSLPAFSGGLEAEISASSPFGAEFPYSPVNDAGNQYSFYMQSTDLDEDQLKRAVERTELSHAS